MQSVSVDIAQESWQFKWNNDVTGNYTRKLIPRVGVKIHLPEDRNVAISYCHLLMHNTMLKKDAYRTGLYDTPVCEWEWVCDREYAEHYLLHRTRYHEARSELRDAVDDILKSMKGEKYLTERLLLAHYNQSENVNRKQYRHIKEALFRSLQKFVESFNSCTINTDFRNLSSLDNRCFHS